MMWAAGDDYLNRAKVILGSSYASSRPSTCQALLLMGYREIGVGAMAQAWTYIGMAIRMAQDLGMHRSADGWARVGLGGRLFSEWELHERKRIWYGCVIMDKYVSSYIGAFDSASRILVLALMIELNQVGLWQYLNGILTLRCPAKTRFVLTISHGDHYSDPSVQPEEFQEWTSFDFKPIEGSQWETKKPVSAPGRIISCFNASATLCAYHSFSIYSSN
jgi:hypothetical protein